MSSLLLLREVNQPAYSLPRKTGVHTDIYRAQSPILCRPALPTDRIAALEFLKLVWGGEDYVPQVWDEWYRAPGGLLAVAVRDARVLALGRIADLGLREAWLEGLRVDPAVRGQRVGSHMHDYLLERWEASDSEVVRLASLESRVEVHRMCRRTGFQTVASLVGFEAPSREGAHRFEPLPPEALDRVVDLLLGSAIVQASHSLIDLGWRFAAIRRARLAPLAEERRIWSWGAGDGALIIRLAADRETPALIQSLAVDRGLRAEMLGEALHLAFDLGAERVRWLIPRDEGLMNTLCLAGFETDWEERLLLLEKAR